MKVKFHVLVVELTISSDCLEHPVVFAALHLMSSNVCALALCAVCTGVPRDCPSEAPPAAGRVLSPP